MHSQYLVIENTFHTKRERETHPFVSFGVFGIHRVPIASKPFGMTASMPMGTRSETASQTTAKEKEGNFFCVSLN